MNTNLSEGPTDRERNGLLLEEFPEQVDENALQVGGSAFGSLAIM